MQEVGLARVLERLADALNKDDIATAEALLWPSLDQFNSFPQLWFHAGNVMFHYDKMALAAICYEKALELEPNGIGYANLGAVYRRMNQRDRAINILQKATDLAPDSVNTWTNLAACYINEGNPRPGLEYATRALEIQPGFARAEWNKSLLHLELEEFAEGFRLYRSGLGKERIIKDYGPLCEYLTVSKFLEHRRKKQERHRLIVYGEQGIGDELMFGSILNDAMKVYDITFDCHPRLESIFRRRWPDLKIYPTRKDPKPTWHDGQRWFISIGDLAGLFRNDRQDFTHAWHNHGPFYSADEDLVRMYRFGLEAAADGRRIIGLATRGGVIKTNRAYRTIEPKDLEPILKDPRYFFVALDYEDVEPTVDHINKEYGPEKMVHFRAITHHFDYDHTAALIKATDCLVTICQSAFHLSAAMAHPTLCLVPNRPAWRYGVKGKKSYWYPSKHVRLIRQAKSGDWSDAVNGLARRLDAETGGSP